jgi:hypothetical protein
LATGGVVWLPARSARLRWFGNRRHQLAFIARFAGLADGVVAAAWPSPLVAHGGHLGELIIEVNPFWVYRARWIFEAQVDHG